MIRSVSEMLDHVSKQKSRKDKVATLQLVGSKYPAVKYILRAALDPKIKFILPEGSPPYKPSEAVGIEGRLHTEARLLYLFIEGGVNIPMNRREQKFIELIESVDPADAKLLCSVKDKKIPYSGITKKLVQEAFPGLIDD